MHAAVRRAIALALAPAPAFATSYVCSTTPDALAAVTEVAFIGRVVSAKPSDYVPPRKECAPFLPDSHCGARMNEMEVTRALRGEPGATVKVLTEDVCACSGPLLAVDGTYLIAARRNTSGVEGDVIAIPRCRAALTPDDNDFDAMVERLAQPPAPAKP